MKPDDIDEGFEKILTELGLTSGDTVFVVANLLTLSLLSRLDVASILEMVLKKIIGDDGTILVQTYTTYVARYGKPFIYESSRCVNGAFSQRILEQKESVRSLHPVNSYTALGKHSKELCKDNSCNNYGIGTPLDGLLTLNGKILRIDISIGSSPLMHYAESVFGVPYNYNKLLDLQVFKGGKLVTNTFCANVRYLHLDVHDDQRKLKNIFFEIFKENVSDLFGIECSLVSAKTTASTYFELLSKDVWAFLKNKPEFKEGVVPFDGLTTGRDGFS